jgi:hypothetical protein
VTTDAASTTWKSNSASGATIGTYTFAVQQLATATKMPAPATSSAGLNSSDTLATIATESPIKAGTFTR